MLSIAPTGLNFVWLVVARVFACMFSAQHCNIKNILKYFHLVKLRVREGEFDVVYASEKTEFTKYLLEGYSLVSKTEWGYSLTKPKSFDAP